PALSLSGGHYFVCFGPDGKTADHHFAVCAAALGLLAAAANGRGIRGRRLAGFDSTLVLLSGLGEDAPFRSCRGGFGRDSAGTASRERGPDGCGSLGVGAAGERLCFLCAIYRKSVLAVSARSHVSASGEFVARLAGVGSGGAAASGVCAGAALARPPLFARRLVLVSGNFSPDDRHYHGWRAGDGRPVRVHLLYR